VLPAQEPGHAAQIRIFTPGREVPFAGHPNVGTAFALAQAMAERNETVPGQFVFEEESRVGSRHPVIPQDPERCKSPFDPAARNCTRDEGGPFGFGDQEPISSHRKLLRAKAAVVSVARAAAARGAPLLRQLQPSGTELAETPACRGQGRVASGRALSARRLEAAAADIVCRTGTKSSQTLRWRELDSGALSVWWGCHGYGRDPYAWESAWPSLVEVFGIPLAVLLIGAGLIWAMRGFKV
jgi:hypothetical protein